MDKIFLLIILLFVLSLGNLQSQDLKVGLKTSVIGGKYPMTPKVKDLYVSEEILPLLNYEVFGNYRLNKYFIFESGIGYVRFNVLFKFINIKIDDRVKISRSLSDVIYIPIRLKKEFSISNYVKIAPLLGYQFGINTDYNTIGGGIVESNDPNEIFGLSYFYNSGNKIVHLFEFGLEFYLELKKVGLVIEAGFVKGINQSLFTADVEYFQLNDQKKLTEVRSDGSHYYLGVGSYYKFSLK